jgi:hypothetical protein
MDDYLSKPIVPAELDVVLQQSSAAEPDSLDEPQSETTRDVSGLG